MGYIPNISPSPPRIFQWDDIHGDGAAFRCMFRTNSNDYMCEIVRHDISADISEMLTRKLGIEPCSEIYFLKVDNAVNQVLKTTFARISKKQRAVGALNLTRSGLDALFTHLAHAFNQFLQTNNLECAFAYGNDSRLHSFYRSAFVGSNALWHGIAVDELDPREVYYPVDSVLAFRRLR